MTSKPARRLSNDFLARAALACCLAGSLWLAGCEKAESASASSTAPSAEAQASQAAESAGLLVTLGGDVTEIVFALGEGPRVAGSDRGSLYPPQVHALPRLDYHRQMSAEGILSLEPEMVLLTAEAGPPTAIEQLRSAGVKVVTVPAEASVDGAEAKIRAVAEALDATEEGDALIAAMRADLAAARDRVAREEERPAVLFVYARAGQGAAMVAGENSPAETMIELSGGRNAASGFEGFKPLTPEAMLEFNPDVVLMLDKGFEAIGGEEGLMGLPGMAETTAGREGRFVALPDDLLLSFGPRLAEAVARLSDALHPAAGAATGG